MKMQVRSVDEVNSWAKNTMMEVLDIRFTKITSEYLEATMPVDHRTHQVHHILHGGASVVLAETLGSVGAALMVDNSQFRCVGLDINANHIRAVEKGLVTGIAKPIHVGRSTQVWAIEIFNEAKQLVSVSRLTVAIVPIKK